MLKEYESPHEMVQLGFVDMIIKSTQFACLPTNTMFALPRGAHITIFVNLGVFWHSETVTNIRTSWIKSHRYWRML